MTHCILHLNFSQLHQKFNPDLVNSNVFSRWNFPLVRMPFPIQYPGPTLTLEELFTGKDAKPITCLADFTGDVDRYAVIGFNRNIYNYTRSKESISGYCTKPYPCSHET